MVTLSEKAKCFKAPEFSAERDFFMAVWAKGFPAFLVSKRPHAKYTQHDTDRQFDDQCLNGTELKECSSGILACCSNKHNVITNLVITKPEVI